MWCRIIIITTQLEKGTPYDPMDKEKTYSFMTMAMVSLLL